MNVSMIIPVHNEEANLPELFGQIKDAMEKIAGNYECLFIDDGSTDDSLNILKALQSRNSEVRIISFQRNFGQTAAMAAGFQYAKGDFMVTLDADLQNDPADIPGLLKKAEEGWDVVSGWRRARRDAFLSRKIPSRIANWIISKVTGVSLHDYGCTLKIYRKTVGKNFCLSGDMHRFLPALASWQGASITEVVVNHRARVAGQSHYGIGRTLRVILDLIAVKFLLSYSTRPIQFFGMGGTFLLFLGFITGANVLWAKCAQGQDMTDNPLLYLVVLFVVVGIQFIMMGLLGEILTRIYQESKKELTYSIKEVF